METTSGSRFSSGCGKNGLRRPSLPRLNFYLGNNTPERQGYIVERPVVPME